MSVGTAKGRLLSLGDAWDADRGPGAVPLLAVAGAGLVVIGALGRVRAPRGRASPLGRVLSAAVLLRVARIVAPLALRAVAGRGAMKPHSRGDHRKGRSVGASELGGSPEPAAAMEGPPASRLRGAGEGREAIGHTEFTR